MPDGPNGAARSGIAGSRFSKSMSVSVDRFNASLPVDRRLYAEDIACSIAHARMLGQQRIIPAEEAAAIVGGLIDLYRDLEVQDGPPLDATDEDIHSFVEARLYERIGAAAGRLHTARSRNDQVATDLRLWTRKAICDNIAALLGLQHALLSRAEWDKGLIFPGYTHLQRAQPVLLSHHWLAYYQMFGRDIDRLADCYERANVLPLGAGALAGSPYPLDRTYVAKQLGFSAVAPNSLDAVADRDFVVEHLAALALVAVHLSRLAEELVLWSSAEFGFVEMDDAYSTGSSIMPQKKNPDVAELVRGKSGRAVGTLVSLLVILKGLPLTYNKDLQEDKEGYFRAFDDSLDCIQLAGETVATLRVCEDRLRAAVSDPLLLATDLADHLTRAGLPFREAHHIVGTIVRDHGARLTKLTPDELAAYSPILRDNPPKLSPRASVQARDIVGGTSPRQVSAALRRARRLHAETTSRLEAVRSGLPRVE